MENLENENENGYQVIVANIFWNSNTKKTNKKDNGKIELPTQMSLTIPEQVLVQANKNKNMFNDIIEQFCYNLLTRKYGREVTSCQIWLPFEN